MIQRNIITTQEPSEIHLARFKHYARITGNDNDAELRDMLRDAMLAVQAYADETLLPCTIEVRDTEATGAVRLYETVDSIISVTSDGTPVTDYSFDGVFVHVAGSSVAITYTTRAHAGSAARLLVKAYRYAAALEEGDDETTLNRILAQC